MDQYGVCRLSDAADIAKYLHNNKQIAFTFTLDEKTNLYLSIHYVTKIFGNVGYGGQPLYKFMVSAPMSGSSFHFDLYDKEPLHKKYVTEKMFLIAEFGEYATIMLNAIKEHLHPLKGSKEIQDAEVANNSWKASMFDAFFHKDKQP